MKQGHLFLGLSVALLAASPVLQAERLPIKVYTTAEGLAHNQVNRIVRDSQGFLWFCTVEGLSRFDGYAFTNFGVDQGLPHPNVNDLLETRGGDYWIATGAGLVRFDPRGIPRRGVVYDKDNATPAPMFTVIVPDDENRRARTLTVVREGSDGTIWAGTNKGLYRLDGERGHRSLRPVDVGMLSEFLEGREVTDLLEDERGSLWIATASGLFRRWADGNAARYGTREGFPSERLSDLFMDHDRRLWVASLSGGFFRLKTDDSRRAPVVDLALTEKDGLLHPWVNQLFETSDGRFFVCTAVGLGEFLPAGDADGRRFRFYTTRHGLSHPYIAGLVEDLGGNLWVSTTNAGAMRLARDGFVNFGEQDGLRSVLSLFEDRAGNVCFRGQVLGAMLPTPIPGVHNRFGCFDGRRFQWMLPAAVKQPGWVMEGITLQARSGEWWIGTDEGVFRFPASDRFADLERARPLARYSTGEGLAASQVFRLFEDSQRNVWISTVSSPLYGLARFEPQSGRLHDFAGAPGLAAFQDDLARSFGEDRDGRVWIGYNSGLARYADGKFLAFTARDGLPPGSIMEMLLDRSGRLWLASASAGLIRIDNPGAEHPTFVAYTTADGLSSNNIGAIAEDAAGRLYVGGGHGLDRIDPATGRVKHFGEGLPAGLMRAAFRDSKGQFWFGTTSGLTRLVPAAETPAAPPPVLITGVRVRGIGRPVSALGEGAVSLPDLATGENQLQIDFVALGFGLGEVLRYQFRLEGADANWSPLSEQRSVTYASLVPGRYRFAVRAMNSDGVASSTDATVAFVVLPPIWQRWWFIALALLAVGAAATSLYRYRVARLLELANMRGRIATDLHDDIGANLTRIALLSEVAKQTRGDAPLSSIARIARESVSGMSDIVWAINPKRETLLDLVRRMRQHAEEVFTLRDIDLTFHAPDAADSLKLGMDLRRDLLLIFKEAINNAARHSRCSAVEIDLRLAGSRLLLSVADNGVSFDPSIERDGQGLLSMQRRARRLGGTLKVSSSAGSGTRISLEAPI